MKDSLRFRVCNLDTQSQAASWGIYKNRKTNDVYVVPRNLGQSIKFSLHQSGNWRFAYIDSFFEENVAPIDESMESRVIDSWERPRDHGDAWKPAIKIITPTVSINSPLSEESKVINLNTAIDNSAIEVQLHIAVEMFPPDGPFPDDQEGLKVMSNLELNSGERVFLSARKITMPDLSSLPSIQAKPFHGTNLDELPERMRMLLYGDDQNGTKCLYDLVNQP